MLTAKQSIVLYDDRFRLVYASYIAPPLSAADIMGKTPWDRSLISDEAEGVKLQAAFMRAVAGGEDVVIEQVATNFIGTWRLVIHPVRNFSPVSVLTICRPVPDVAANLPPRLLELAKHIAAHTPTKKIAAAMGISRATVDSQRANLARRLRVATSELDFWIGSHVDLFR